MNKRDAEHLCKILDLPIDKLISIGEGHWTFSSPISVSPKKAAFLLEHNTENRAEKNRNIGKITNDIRAGCWHSTHNGIAFRDKFDENGKPVLADGQNRLKAIVRAKKRVKIRIYLGVTKNQLMILDSNQVGRTPKDTLSLLGYNVVNKQISAFNAFWGGERGGAGAELSTEQIQSKLEEYGWEIGVVFEHIPANTRAITAPVRGAIMRALHYHKDDEEKVEQIEEFCGWLASGTNIESKVIADFLRDLNRQNYGGVARKEIYARTKNVLYHFLHRPDGKRVKLHKEEIWPLGHELEAEGERI